MSSEEARLKEVSARISEPPCAAIIRQALAAVHDEQDWLSPYRRAWALRVLAETVERSNILTVEA